MTTKNDTKDRFLWDEGDFKIIKAPKKTPKKPNRSRSWYGRN